jgi:hypothetical protein
MGQRNYNLDVAMRLKDAGLIAASAAAQVGGAAAILDLGISGGGNAPRFEGMAFIDVTAVEIDTANELYTISIQGSSSATFASDVQTYAAMQLGSTSVRPGGAIDSLIGRYELPFVTEQADVRRRYLRAYITVVGTIATGINCTINVAPYEQG